MGLSGFYWVLLGFYSFFGGFIRLDYPVTMLQYSFPYSDRFSTVLTRFNPVLPHFGKDFMGISGFYGL